MDITADMPEHFRAGLRAVRLDLFTDLPGIIVCASEQTGLALMQVRPKVDGDMGQQEFALGQNGLRIVAR